jgi:hypothetical protein
MEAGEGNFIQVAARYSNPVAGCIDRSFFSVLYFLNLVNYL